MPAQQGIRGGEETTANNVLLQVSMSDFKIQASAGNALQVIAQYLRTDDKEKAFL